MSRETKEGAGTILVAEHDPSLKEEMRSLLEEQGYQVLQATDGAETREMVYRHSPDLVIVDLQMPHQGGIPVLEHFRDKAAAPPMIMITAHGRKIHRAYVEYLGAADYLSAPLCKDRLLESVQQALAGEENPSGAGEPA